MAGQRQKNNILSPIGETASLLFINMENKQLQRKGLPFTDPAVGSMPPGPNSRYIYYSTLYFACLFIKHFSRSNKSMIPMRTSRE